MGIPFFDIPIFLEDRLTCKTNNNRSTCKSSRTFKYSYTTIFLIALENNFTPLHTTALNVVGSQKHHAQH